MRLVFGLVLMLGLGLAGFAVYMAKDYMAANQAALDAQRANQGPAIQTQPVFVTTRAVNYGERLTQEDIKLVAFPQEAIPEGAFSTAEEMFPQGVNIERSVLRSMEQGEAVLAVKVTEPGEDAGVSARLSPGKRAFAISVDVSSGVSGFLRPGDRVDVYWTGTVKSSGPERQDVTKLIQSGVKLVAIDQSSDEDRSGATVARTVTVEATPRDVAALAQAQSTGRLSLALLGTEDDSVAEAVEIDQRELLGIVEEKRVEVKEEQVCTIRTRRGAEVIEIPIPCTN
ncbi:Flp pilus assembly protein CpaB [Palleronia pelagia]|uniref:Pilus assembly protein CpaB n=1 Tax=Palleronia pelagia TaxID=387096 RepID=A0A1H8JDR6_9RHOB|nr:Flp pilus assembly protein CpaB [Palleronia pelagia]SEN78879.1 pilus assembly protein CpaB [Palleronia pelagia]